MNASSDPTTLSTLLASAREHLYPNYAQPDVVMDHGRGAQLWDTQGRHYIDFHAGIAVSTLGHAHPQMVQALSEQAGRIIHLSNYFFNAPNIALAEELCTLAKMDRALFCNSGTEAVEAALKLTRRHHFQLGFPERNMIIAFDNSFHGRTMGALAATGQKKYRDGFGPLEGVVHAPFGDVAAARSLMNDRVAGILVEPIQGEGGVVPAPDGFLQGLRQLCNESSSLLVLDEVQTGIGRTGTFLCCEHWGVSPDVVALAKGLGGGFPIGAVLCTESLKDALPPGSHGSTYAGNPMASTAALTVLSVLLGENLLARSVELGKRLSESLDELCEKHSRVTLRRGLGLMQGLVLADPSEGSELLTQCREAGLLLTFAGGTTLRLTPPLVISDDELMAGLSILDEVLGRAP